MDESHYFKNLGIPVRTDGFSVAASKRATDLDMKLALLRERGGKTAALFTGTPVSNSLLEMYVLQHYLHPGRLAEVGLHSADAWAATFVDFQTSVEVTPDGASFRMKRRPTKFENVPELLTLFGEVADLRQPESFAVQRPAVRHHNVVISSSPQLRAYVASLAERADRVRQVDAHEDNMLKICSDGRKAALDLELVGITAAGPGKTGAVIANVARIYHANRTLALPGDDPAAPGGGFQIIFCDLGTPNATAGSQVYGKIRAGLADAGVPAGQIRFIHDASTDLQKAALFAECRAGKVAVLLGSTDKLGVGTNIQTRCVALHHVDAPWRPADVEQREGRALRPGNLNPSVDIYRYVSERSFDSFLWQILERKARFIGQVLGGRPAGRDVDDIGDATLSYAEVKALATGNPLLLELAEANAEVTRLRHLATAHTRATRRLESSITGWQQQIIAKTRHADTLNRLAAAYQDHTDPAWRDQRGTAIPGHDVAACLARLSRDAMASSGYGMALWRGLRISFSAERKWRQITPIATISAGAASLAIELNPAWTVKGQYWRIEKELTASADGAAAAAQRLRREIEDLRHRLTDATRRTGEPFPQAADLEAARARRDTIQQDIRDAAAPPEDGTEAGPDDLPRAAMDPADALAGTDSIQEVTYTPARISPQITEPAEDAGHAGSLDSPAGAVSAVSPPAVTPEPGSAPAHADEEHPPEASVPRAATQPSLPSAGHPALVASLDTPVEPLFDLPLTAPDQSAGQIPRARRPARRRGPRRKQAQAAARDNVQGALFDLPPPAQEPARPVAPARNQTRAPRR